MFLATFSAGTQPCVLLKPAPCKKAFAATHSRQSRHRSRSRAESNGANGKPSARSELGDDVLQKLREAEQEAATLRQQLADAKAKAQVRSSRCKAVVVA